MMETQNKTLLLGTTGRVGGAVLQKLGTTEMSGLLRVLTRRPMAVPHSHPFPIEVINGDISDIRTVKRALNGVDTVLLVIGDHPGMAAQEIQLINTAAALGTIRIVKISAITAGLSPRVSFGVQHGAVEDALIASGLPYVILRPTFFYQSLELFKEPIKRGFLPASTKRGAIGFVDLEDVAVAAARALTDRSLDGTVHILTGPETLTMAEVAAGLTVALNHKVRHVSPPRFLMPTLLKHGASLNGWLAGQVASLMTCCAAGGENYTSDAVLNLTGKQPKSLSDYLTHAAKTFTR
ncbi:NAD(P)H-binding protein [Kordiimonas pumila]|uniref:NAD(P)H-binding protein n=1 Tax=Kordiimonas pumila TaxID=2161677 RepID=A0ABV7D5L1_9PROT|nr:NAD(P)H-binding protein [Kordiimonas pumila]